MEGNKDYLTKQIITYLGNKRKLLSFIQRPLEQNYHAFRGSRNLSSRPLKVKEQLYIINKHKGK